MPVTKRATIKEAQQRLETLLKGIKAVNGIGISRGNRSLLVGLVENTGWTADELPQRVLGFPVRYHKIRQPHKRS